MGYEFSKLNPTISELPTPAKFLNQVTSLHHGVIMNTFIKLCHLDWSVDCCQPNLRGRI